MIIRKTLVWADQLCFYYSFLCVCIRSRQHTTKIADSKGCIKYYIIYCINWHCYRVLYWVVLILEVADDDVSIGTSEALCSVIEKILRFWCCLAKHLHSEIANMSIVLARPHVLFLVAAACLPAYLPMYLSVCLSVCLPVCLPACLSVCLRACLSVCLPACLPACLSVCSSLVYGSTMFLIQLRTSPSLL